MKEEINESKSKEFYPSYEEFESIKRAATNKYDDDDAEEGSYEQGFEDGYNEGYADAMAEMKRNKSDERSAQMSPEDEDFYMEDPRREN